MKTLLGAAVVMAGVWSGCSSEPAPPTYAARVGQQTLSHAELDSLVGQVFAGEDTVGMRRTLLDQWVSSALLYDAAQREGMLREDELRDQIERNTRAIASSAYLERHFDEHAPTFTDAQIQAYFDSHRDGLKVREPYVEYRLFGAPTEAEVRRARADLTRRGGVADTLWQQWPRRDAYTVVPLAAEPERGLYATVPEVRDALLSLRAGQTSGVIEADSSYYVVQIVERVDEGGDARLAWVRPEIEHRLLLDARKQMARRLVQTLRAEALSRASLDITLPPDTLQ